MSDATVTDDDKTYCETIAKSISDIIRFSLNEEFRKSSCDLFGVFSTKDAEMEMSKRLMTILENKNADPKKKRLPKKKNKGDVEKEQIFEEKTTDESSMSTDCSSQTQNNSQTNWLRISSEQCRKAVKRRQLQFYSQPYMPHEKNFEFSSVNINLSHSQPSEFPSSSQSNEMIEPFDSGPDFCKRKFKELFKENAEKYLRRNLKYRKHSRF